MLRPLSGNVILEPVEIEKKTASGIILTGEAAEPKHKEGIVVAVGPGFFDHKEGVFISPEVKVGERVIYMPSFQIEHLNYEGKKLILITQHDILAVIE